MKSTSDEKRGRGAPSAYRPEYCDEVINLMATGLSLTAAMAELGFCRQTAYDWKELHEDFAYAMALGQGKRSLFLERRGISAESGPAVTFVIAALKNCNREDFRDHQEIEHSGAIDTNAAADDAKRKLAALAATASATAVDRGPNA